MRFFRLCQLETFATAYNAIMRSELIITYSAAMVLENDWITVVIIKNGTLKAK